jgi:mxaJ protein
VASALAWALAALLVLGSTACVAAGRDGAGDAALRDDADDAPLRVCADPDNLPYSHRDGRGFELAIARVLADALDAPLQVHWRAQRRAFVRKAWRDAACDVWLGVPAQLDGVLPTRPYYRSGYAIVTRADDAAPLRTLSDARLPRLRIGIALVGDDLAATPVAYALARHGAIERVRGVPVEGPAPAAQRLIDALAERSLDATIVWGPQAGWFAAQARTPLALTLVQPIDGDAALPFEFDIALGVRPGLVALRDRLDAALVARRDVIDAILARHHVPRTDHAEAAR